MRSLEQGRLWCRPRDFIEKIDTQLEQNASLRDPRAAPGAHNSQRRRPLSPIDGSAGMTSSEPPKKKKRASPLAKGVAGAISGGIETFCVWPLESVKTKLQLTRRLAKTNPNAPPPPFNGMISCFRYTVQSTGFLSLYRGMAPVLIGSVPKAGLRFGLFDYLDQLFLKPDGSTTSARTLLAGSTAGAIESLLVVTPVETIKTKLIDLNMGTVRGTKHIIATEGFRGVYKGAIPTTLKQGSNQGLRFMAFSKYKEFMSPDGKALDPARAMLGGMLAGCFSTMLNNPFDAVKTRMQGTQAKELYSGFFDCVRKIVKQEGMLTLWSGVVPRLARVVPGQGIIFASSETITQFTSKLLD